METYINRVLGYEHPLEVPSLANEFDSMPGCKTGDCVKAANKYVILHITNNEGRSVVVETLEKITGIMRKMKPGPTKADGTPGAEVPAESDKVYKDRALAESGKTHEETVPEVTMALAAVKYDPSPSERTGGAGKISKEFYAIADGLIEKGPEACTKAVKRLKKLNPGLEIKLLDNGIPDRDSLASAARVNGARVAKLASEELLAA